MSLQWFKFYGSEYLSDPKISSMTPQERSCWLTLLCLASNSSEIGKIEYLTIESLLDMSGIKWNPYDTTEWDNAQAVLSKLERMKMIKTSADGVITILNWDKRQEHNLTVAERVAKSRAKKKNVTTNVTNVTSDQIRLDKIRLKDIYTTFKKVDKKSSKKEEIKLPIWLNKEKWEEWIEYRKQSKKKMTDLTTRKQIQFLSENIKDHIKIIDRSILNGWQGLFKLDNSFNNSDASKVLKRRIEDEETKREREQSSADSEAIRKINSDIKRLADSKKI